jgi:hypothetical protein
MTVTKFVTAYDSLVLSPLTGWDTREGNLEIWEAFDECVAGLANGSARWLGRSIERRHRIIAPSPDGIRFRVTAVTREGFGIPDELPMEWAGLITRQIAVSYLRVDWYGFLDSSPRRSKTPWDELFSHWERVDGYGADESTRSGWLNRRKRVIKCNSSFWWWEVRGLRERGDARAFDEMWEEATMAEVYLGWPAYFLDILGRVTKCLACGNPTPQGRRYCDDPACIRRRALERQRRSRMARGN